MTYYNTNKLEGEALKEAHAKTMTQDQVILKAFESNPNLRLSPDFIWQRVFKETVPITSVRRSMTNLTKAGKLEKTDSMSIGSYGKPVHRWKLA